MKYILNHLKKYAHPKGLLISIITFIVTAITINGNIIGVAAMKKVSNGVGILDLEPGYTVARVYEMLEMMGEAGRQYYLSHIIPLDFIFPLTYGIAFSLTILFLIQKLMPNNESALGLAYIPLTSMCFDYLENISIIRILINYPNQLDSVVQASNLFTMIKSSLTGFSILIIVLCLMVLLIKNGAKKVGLR